MLQIAGLLFANPSSTASLAFNLISGSVWNGAFRGTGVAHRLMFGRLVTHLATAVTFRNALREKPIFIGLMVMQARHTTTALAMKCNPNVGAGLLANAECQSLEMLIDLPHSRASPLPQGISTVCKIPQKSPIRLTPNGALYHQPALRHIHGLVRLNQMRHHPRVCQGGDIPQPVILSRGNLAQNPPHDFPRARLR